MNYKILLMSIMFTFYMNASSKAVESASYQLSLELKNLALEQRIQALEQELAYKTSPTYLSEIVTKILAEGDYVKKEEFDNKMLCLTMSIGIIDQRLNEQIEPTIRGLLSDRDHQRKEQQEFFCLLQEMQTELNEMKYQLQKKIQLAHQVTILNGFISNLKARVDALENPNVPLPQNYHGSYDELDAAIAWPAPGNRLETAPASASTTPALFCLDPSLR